MTWHMIVKALWPIALLFFLGLSAAQISERLKAKSSVFYTDWETGVTSVEQTSAPVRTTRATAMLGGACILLVPRLAIVSPR